MDAKDYMMGGSLPDWDTFNTPDLDTTYPGQSPYGGSNAFPDFTDFNAYDDKPMSLGIRQDPSKPGSTVAGAQAPQNALGQFASAESSSQGSSSETSSQRKRKTASESPMSDAMTETGLFGAQVKKEDSKMSIGDMHPTMDTSFDAFAQPVHNLSLRQQMGQNDANLGVFNFHSASSSPTRPRDFSAAMSLDTRANMPPSTLSAQTSQDAPTINPTLFAMADSRDQSPAMFNTTNGLFSTPSSDGADYTADQIWAPSMAQTPACPNDFGNQLVSPGGAAFTASPISNSGTPASTNLGQAEPATQSPLHIAPIATKSRVETQINLDLTLERPPPDVEHLHLPIHTIAKSKLLAKEDCDKSKVLELHTMLVCTSAMRNASLKAKALRRAAAQSNDDIQRQAERLRESPEEDKNDPKAVDDADKPANGGEVRICNNCIQRERKRAGRKKTKREEEQQHWERYETERVVVFNSNEYLPFKACEPGPSRDSTSGVELDYTPPEGAVHVTAAMRIACYCRHQAEKDGFQVIFTMKDQRGNIVAQQISDSILITDDHKTQPQSYQAPMGGEAFYPQAAYMPHGLHMSQSMIDLPTHVQPFTSPRSHGNLPALPYGVQFSPNGHMHQFANSAFTSGTTSATMTPTSLSRPGSPSGAGQGGPNKKRKSSSSLRKLPSGLVMTPRVDTNQPPSSGLPSAMSMTSGFSPTAFNGQLNPSYMTMPQNGGSAHYYSSGPPTPSESGPGYNFSQPQVDLSRMQSNQQAYFSHPSSAVPSRASSPVLQQSRSNMAAYARQQPIQTPTNMVPARPVLYGNPMSNDGSHGQYPTMSRITPTEGPVTGGTEVVIFGEGFVPGNSIMFGQQIVQARFMNPTTLVAFSPPCRQGSVHLTILSPPAIAPYPPPASRPIFEYVQPPSAELMAMALKHLSEQNGAAEPWQSFAQQHASSYVQSRVQRAGPGQEYPGGNRMAAAPAALVDSITALFPPDAADAVRPTAHAAAQPTNARQLQDLFSATFPPEGAPPPAYHDRGAAAGADARSAPQQQLSQMRRPSRPDAQQVAQQHCGGLPTPAQGNGAPAAWQWVSVEHLRHGAASAMERV